VNTRTPVMPMEGGQDLETLSKNKNIRNNYSIKLLFPVMESA